VVRPLMITAATPSPPSADPLPRMTRVLAVRANPSLRTPPDLLLAYIAS
jgi:hypothetical protein